MFTRHNCCSLLQVAIKLLKEGNGRFVGGTAVANRISPEVRKNMDTGINHCVSDVNYDARFPRLCTVTIIFYVVSNLVVR